MHFTIALICTSVGFASLAAALWSRHPAAFSASYVDRNDLNKVAARARLPDAISLLNPTLPGAHMQ